MNPIDREFYAMLDARAFGRGRPPAMTKYTDRLCAREEELLRKASSPARPATFPGWRRIFLQQLAAERDARQ